MKQVCMNALACVCINVLQHLVKEAASELMHVTRHPQQFSLACRGKIHA